MATLKFSNGEKLEVSPRFRDTSSILLEELDEFPIFLERITKNDVQRLDYFINNVEYDRSNINLLSKYILEDIVTLYNNSIFFSMDDQIINILMNEMVYRLTDRNTIVAYRSNNVKAKEILNELDLPSQYELLEKLKLHYNNIWSIRGYYTQSSVDLNAILTVSPNNEKLLLYEYEKGEPREINNIDYDIYDIYATGINNKYQVIGYLKSENEDTYTIINNTTNEQLEIPTNLEIFNISRNGKKIRYDHKIKSFPDNKIIGYSYSTNDVDDYEGDIAISEDFNFSILIGNKVDTLPYLSLKDINKDIYISLDHIAEPFLRVLGLNYKDRSFKHKFSALEDKMAIIDHNDEYILILIIDTHSGIIIKELVLKYEGVETQDIYPCEKGLYYIKYEEAAYDEEELEVSIYYMRYNNDKFMLIFNNVVDGMSVGGIVGLDDKLLLNFKTLDADNLQVYKYIEGDDLQEFLTSIVGL